MSQSASEFINNAINRVNQTPAKRPTSPAYTRAAGGLRIGRLAASIVILGGVASIAIATIDRIGSERFIPGLSPDASLSQPSAEYEQAVKAGVFDEEATVNVADVSSK